MNNSNYLTAKQLIHLIERAFHGVPPSNISLAIARHIDDHWGTELEEGFDPESHRDWQDVTEEELKKYNDVFPFFDAQAFRFYIPAFMIWCIRKPRLAATDLTLSSLWLEPDSLELLNKAQRQVIAEFLKFSTECFDDYDKEEALKLYVEYWGEYDK